MGCEPVYALGCVTMNENTGVMIGWDGSVNERLG